MQNWRKIHRIYAGTEVPGYAYASVPVAQCLGNNLIRIYFSSRDERNRSVPFYLDYDLFNHAVVYIHKYPVLTPGRIGLFDDSGVMPCCLLRNGDEDWMYYIGWNLGVTVPFRNAVGLAVSEKNSSAFVKMYEGPILDRTIIEPYFTASCCVLRINEVFKMWYLGCVEWVMVNNRPVHKYHIKYAESNDGICWVRNNIVAIDFKYPNEYAISVPRVLFEEDTYKMWYSYRGGPISKSYRIGYAESKDGVNWNRMDELINFSTSNNDWDSSMICYPCVFDYDGKKYMLYNGNDYGRTGFGMAILEK